MFRHGARAKIRCQRGGGRVRTHGRDLWASGTGMPSSPTSSGSPSSKNSGHGTSSGHRISLRRREPLLRPTSRLGHVPLTSGGSRLRPRSSLVLTKRISHLLPLPMGVTYVLFPTRPPRAIGPHPSIPSARSRVPLRHSRRSPLSRRGPTPHHSPLSQQMTRPPWAQRRAKMASVRTRISRS